MKTIISIKPKETRIMGSFKAGQCKDYFKKLKESLRGVKKYE